MEKDAYLIKHILESRFNSKQKIQNILKTFSISLKTKKFLIISQILNIRNLAAIKIQKAFHIYKQIDYRLLLKKILSKTKVCYTISPSKNNTTNAKIKIYYDLSDITKFKIINLNFCPIRKRYVCDIPKYKFLKSNKTFRFNFIINNEEIIDNNYRIKLINRKYINEIDFKTIDEKIRYLNDTIYRPILYGKLMKRLRYKSVDSTEPEEDEKIFNSEEDDEDDYKSLRAEKPNKNNLNFKFRRNRNERISDDLTKTYKINGMQIPSLGNRKRINSSCSDIIQIKGILKNSGSLVNRQKKRRISFGKVQFAY
jgi:hypothetical protein